MEAFHWKEARPQNPTLQEIGLGTSDEEKKHKHGMLWNKVKPGIMLIVGSFPWFSIDHEQVILSGYWPENLKNLL